MPRIPSDGQLDSTLALLANPYFFIAERCRRLETDLFETRILLGRTICMTGPAAAELFYRNEQLVRKDAMPARIQKTLLGEGGVQGLDGEAHRHRKRMFMSLMTSARIGALRDRMRQLLDARANDWEGMDRVVLYDETREILAKAVCAWAGVPLPPADVARRTRQLTGLFQNAGSVGPRHWRARLSRHRLQRWASRMGGQVRDGSLEPQEESALHVIATWRDPDGALLRPAVAAVELLNVLRPTVAVSVFMTSAAHALHEHGDWQHKLREDQGNLEPFVQEVRRFYPFFPAVAAWSTKDFRWRDYHFPQGRRILLDLTGTNSDPRTWDAPGEFRPDRFQHWNGNAFTFIPQGGGSHDTGHRCPGEWIAIELMKAFCDFLVGSITYDLPDQDLSIDLSSLPALPKSRVVISRIRRRTSLRHDRIEVPAD